MPNLSKTHPPVRGKLAISLKLAKRRRGVSQLEAMRAGGGMRLSAQVQSLEGRGHHFDVTREITPDGSRPARYWWRGYEQDFKPHAA